MSKPNKLARWRYDDQGPDSTVTVWPVEQGEDLISTENGAPLLTQRQQALNERRYWLTNRISQSKKLLEEWQPFDGFISSIEYFWKFKNKNQV